MVPHCKPEIQVHFKRHGLPYYKMQYSTQWFNLHVSGQATTESVMLLGNFPKHICLC